MKPLASTKKDVDWDKDRGDVAKLESVEIVLVHCNLKYYLLLCQINNLDS